MNVRAKISCAIRNAALLFLMSTTVVYSDIGADGSVAPSAVVKRAAILPFVNNTGNYRAIDIMMPLINETLAEKLINVYPPDELRPILRKNRIRSSGMTCSDDASTINDEIAVQYLVVGSLDYFNEIGILEVGLTIRIIEVSSMRMIYSKSHASSGVDYQKIFGIGRVSSIELLTAKVVGEALADLTAEALEQRCQDKPRKLKIAVIEFDNLSRTGRAGGIVTNQVISQLHGSNCELVEPGMINDFMLKNKTLFRGDIDLVSLAQLKNALGIDLIVTGVVDQFTFARGKLGESGPEVRLWVSVVDASNSKLLFMEECYRKGEDSEKIFRLGKCFTLGRLSEGVIANVIDRFFEDSKYGTVYNK